MIRLGSHCAVVGTGLALVVCLKGGAAVAQTVEVIDTMRTYVEQNGLDGFREAVAANGWQAPVMPSKWHLENKAAPEAVPVGEAARALGYELVRKTDGWANFMHSENGQDLFNRATRLVDLAEWIGAAEGYGNFFAAGHACDVALTGLARLVADLAFPLEDVKAQVESCNLSVISPAAGARILNQEVGDQTFPEDASTREDISRPYRARAGWALSQPVPAQERQGIDDLFRQEVAKLGLDPNVPDPQAAFFRDESCGRTATTERCWDKKRHELIVTGWRLPTRLRRLNRLITFREAVGEYPTTAASPNSVFSNVQVAFDKAWRPHYSTGTENLGIEAGRTYEMILAGRFIDFDTSQRRRGSVVETPVPSPVPTNGTPAP